MALPTTRPSAGLPFAERPPPARPRHRPSTRAPSSKRTGARSVGWRPDRLGRWVRQHKVRTAVVVLVVVAMVPGASLVSALTNPGMGSTVPGRLAEWVRDHGGATIVNWAENTWYSHHPPPVGGQPARGTIPSPHHGASSSPATGTVSTPHLPIPSAIVPVVGSPLPGEGQWHPVGRLVGGVPAVYEAFVRPDSIHTSVVTGVAWMDTTLLRATLYSGSTIPGGGPYTHTAPVSGADALSLIAAFNAGFRMGDSQGGYFTDGHTVIPLRTGAASVVVYRDGNVALGAWGTDVAMTSEVVSVRQNLDLLVDNGKPVAGLSDANSTAWGSTLGGSLYVWRSALGITADDALVYVGGPSLDIVDLANVLVRAGAVRGLELDINTDWVNFASYDPSPGTPAAPPNGTDLLATMVGQPDRYFEPWWSRDFFTMSARVVVAGTAPRIRPTS